MRIVYRGNHQPDLPADVAPWSTEAHLAASLELLGHDVVRNHEQTDDWRTTVEHARGADLFVWTSTWGYAQQWPRGEASGSLRLIGERIPTVAVHLDRWWHLAREQQVSDRRRGHVMFECRWVFTADGDNDALWERYGVNHRWLPPGVFGPECTPGTPNDEYRADVAFVGSWEGYEHAEHWHERRAMLDALRQNYGHRFVCWPRRGRPAVRGADLNDLYASTKVVVGDSCLAATSNRYWSDRIFETVGRGGFCVHPAIPGLVELLPDDMGVAYFAPGDWREMIRLVDWWLAHDDARDEARAKGQRFVREHHSYERRMQQMLDVLEQEGALR